MIYLVLVLVGTLVLVSRVSPRIVFIPTPDGEFGKNGEVSSFCTQHYHSYSQ
jgi:hypothetical protein